VAPCLDSMIGDAMPESLEPWCLVSSFESGSVLMLSPWSSPIFGLHDSCSPPKFKGRCEELKAM